LHRQQNGWPPILLDVDAKAKTNGALELVVREGYRIKIGAGFYAVTFASAAAGAGVVGQRDV
jgi:hypothetical protein